MTANSLLGRVIVVAGADPALAHAAHLALDAGAQVAVVSTSLQVDDATLRFRADPSDIDVWERIAMHVEQHLGPVDGVVTDERCAATVAPVFAPDLARRGHGDVVIVSADTEPGSVLTRLAHMPPEGPPRSRDAAARP